MKKGSLAAIALGTIGGLIFAIGMCMCLITAWGAFVPGVIMGTIGALVLLAIWPVYRRIERRPRLLQTALAKKIFAVGLLGTALLGVGVTISLTATSMLWGIVLGGLGILLLLGTIPMLRRAANKGPLRLAPGKVLAYMRGTLGALVMGYGMSQCMLASAGLPVAGLIFGILGLIICIVNFPLYAIRSRKYAVQ